ncbi:hypothetical protein KGF54_004477 [Candida jiufengensis]|uniref:uncharacterized protein n=1 Tax=Candida jiufengensis TaxID=497108 RepID=UPI00222549CC|nr:uncharacterized protein KGF54_004477 [Candida jiufengensis]KAI5951403.1 hypothetical protein KGF54_004477 [Candida jiufengensis]
MSQLNLLEVEVQQDYLIYSDIYNIKSKNNSNLSISNQSKLTKKKSIEFNQYFDAIDSTKKMVGFMFKSNLSTTSINSSNVTSSRTSTSLKRKPPPLSITRDLEKLDDSVPKRSPARLFERFKLSSSLTSSENLLSPSIQATFSRFDKTRKVLKKQKQDNSTTAVIKAQPTATSSKSSQSQQSIIPNSKIETPTIEPITTSSEPASPVSSYNDSRSTFERESQELDSESSIDESSNHSLQLKPTATNILKSDNISIYSKSSHLIKRALDFDFKMDDEYEDNEPCFMEDDLYSLFDAVKDAEIAKIDDVIKITGQYDLTTASKILVSN